MAKVFCCAGMASVTAGWQEPLSTFRQRWAVIVPRTGSLSVVFRGTEKVI
jgi:hypothetical protein